MRRLLGLVGIATLVLGLPPVAATADHPDPDAIPGSYIVVLRAGDPGAVSAEHSRAHNVQVIWVYRHALRGYAARMSAVAAARVAADQRVAYVEPDRVVTTAHHQCGHSHPRFGDGSCDDPPPEATTYTLSGTVTSSGGGGISSATVSVEGGPSTTTGANGAYSIAGLAPSTYSVTASASGHDSQVTSVSVSANTVQDFVLSQQTTTGYTVPTGLRRSFWPDSALGRTYPAVAVIDTGIAPSHPDLNVVGGHNCQNGPAHNWGDGNGHGTHVAGTIAANGNASLVGVAPNAPLYAVRVLNNAGSGSWSNVICGIDWVTARASTIKVANMSLTGGGSAGSGCSSSSLRQAICNSVNAGVTYVVAAGNSGADASGFVPAAYPEVITVAALADFDGAPGGGATPTCRAGTDDSVASFSNYGSAVDVIAPGVCITSTWHSGSGYNTISGTSMAAPHVAGAAVMIRAANGNPRTVLSGMATTGYCPGTTCGGSTLAGAPWPFLDLSGL